MKTLGGFLGPTRQRLPGPVTLIPALPTMKGTTDRMRDTLNKMIVLFILGPLVLPVTQLALDQ